MNNIFLELSKFNNIKYFDEPHKYYIGDRELVSATTFIGKFKEKFETQVMAENYAKKRGLKVEDVINDWDYKRDFSTVKGSAVHLYAENMWNNKIFPYDPAPVIKRFGLDTIKEKYDKCISHFTKFYDDAKDNLIPIKMELVVGDEEYGIAGQIDGFFYNTKSNEFQIWDYKTNKEIKKTNDFGKTYKAPISHLAECEFNTYSLQLGLYKHIIERNTNIKIGDCFLVWINEVNDSYKVIKCEDRKAELVTMLDYHKSLVK
jgi:hypothetical protein